MIKIVWWYRDYSLRIIWHLYDNDCCTGAVVLWQKSQVKMFRSKNWESWEVSWFCENVYSGYIRITYCKILV